MLAENEVLHDRYRILRQLGHGGMGTVYEAVDTRAFDKAVALKEILADSAETPDRKRLELVTRAFEREARILTTLDHDAFPQVIEYFSEKGRQFLVMQLIGGDDLATLLFKHGKPFPVEEVTRWTLQLLDALDYLHTLTPKPIFHRDIKPQNLKLTTRGIIKLLDFGIAKGAEGDSSITLLNQTFVGATMHFSPLEQILRVQDAMFQLVDSLHGDRVEDILLQSTDARSDIYALGATVYHLLTARLPTDARERALEVWSGNPDPLPNPMECNGEIPPEVSAILLKSMAIDRERRFNSAVEMKEAFDKAAAQIKQSEQNSRRIAESGVEDSREIETLVSSGKPLIQQIGLFVPDPASENYSRTAAPMLPVPVKQSAVTQTDAGNALHTLFGTAETPQPKRRSFWLLPAAGLFLLMLGGVFFGIARLTPDSDKADALKPSETTAASNISANQAATDNSNAVKAGGDTKTESRTTPPPKASQPTVKAARAAQPPKNSKRQTKNSRRRTDDDDKIDVGRILDDIIGRPD